MTPRKYPNVPCPRGHNTYAKQRNKIRYCPVCREHYTLDGALYRVGEHWRDDYGNEHWRALSDSNGRYNEEWTDIEDRLDAAYMTPRARARLLAEIDRLDREERERARERFQAQQQTKNRTG